MLFRSEVIYTPEFYLMKHLSYYVRSGASLLTVSDNSDLLAFKNTDGKIVIVIANTSATDKVQSLKVGEKYIELTLKSNSFNTLVF